MTTSKTPLEAESQVEDRELMRYYDGEIDDDRAEEIERWLEVSDDGVGKLATLDVLGDILREEVDGDDRADDVADAVMARLDEAQAEGGVEDDAEPLPQVEVAPPRGEGSTSGAANDNATRIFLLAAAAAAAATGLFFWGSRGPADLEPPPHARYEPTARETAEAPPKPAPETVAEAADEDDEGGVEIAAVDFGAHRGSVFYVGGDAAGRTPVVWINDAGGE